MGEMADWILDNHELTDLEGRDAVECKTCMDTGCPFPDHRWMCGIHHCPDCKPLPPKNASE